MSEVFISYRQTDDVQKQRVREFAERLREAGIDVVFDQFFLDSNPAGPNEGWPRWSSAHALETEFVLIVGTDSWFQCFEKKQPPGTGLGAAREAHDIFQRIYDASGVIDDIRIVVLDEAEAAHIPGQLRGYHRFHSERNFADIVSWLNGTSDADDELHPSIPHNLPTLQPFFGREEELSMIADALDPESRTWGVLIDGPGGMGKTSLAVRAAYDASGEDFDKIVFVSLKSRELDDNGIRDLSGFLISGLAELLNELARELGHADIAKEPEQQRPRMLLEALRGTHTLLILDNLESLLKSERDIVLTLIKKLPQGCKAILTSRVRIGSAAEELILKKLDEPAALATVANLAEHNETLAKANKGERRLLYRETGGKPLLLRWTAGQIGRGSCLTLADAITYLRSCPEGNDPLEFIFGDLVADFSEAETRVLCALTYFTIPAKVEHVTELAECSEADADNALRSLVNRSLVMPNKELKTFTLVPLVADFLRNKRPQMVAEIGELLEKRVFELAQKNGYEEHNRFPILDVAWPLVTAALPRFLAGPNDRLQILCDALDEFFNFTGRWDEWLAFERDAESRAVAAKDFLDAGWRAHRAGWVHYLRGQSIEVLTCAERAAAHWGTSRTHETAVALHLRGTGYKLAGDNFSAIADFREAVALWRTLSSESEDVAMGLNALAYVERLSGNFDAAERDHREALRIARTIKHHEGIAIYTGNLAELAIEREDWLDAEATAREALSLAEKIGRQEEIASDCRHLAYALMRQGKKAEALLHARRAVGIFSRLASPDLADARTILAECESKV